MRIALAAIIAVGAALFYTPVQGETSLEVESYCRPLSNLALNADGTFSIPQTFESAFCWGEFAAIQGFATMAWANGTRVTGFCAPAESTRLELIRIFEHYAREHPERGHMRFEDVALSAMLQAFPCTQ